MINDLVVEALKISGSKQRYLGVVSKISGTTTFIESGDREFLSWSSPGLKVGTSVEFSIDQFRAVRVEVQPVIGERNSEEMQKESTVSTQR